MPGVLGLPIASSARTSKSVVEHKKIPRAARNRTGEMTTPISKPKPKNRFSTMAKITTLKPPGKGVPFTWEEPDTSLLEDRRGTLPAFPDDVFPPGVSDWLARASRGAGTLVNHIAIPMLGVTSSLIGKARRVQASSSWIEPMTLWACVVGASGDRKTPGLKVVTRAL